MTLDPERVRKVREGESGTVMVLYLDITSEAYLKAGEPGDMVLALDRAASEMVYALVTSLLASGDEVVAVRLEDEAERGVMQFIATGSIARLSWQ